MTRRAPIVLSATALGLAATLGFNAHHAQGSGATATIVNASAPASGGGSSSSSSSAGSSGSSGSSSSGSSSSSGTKTVTSAAESTPYGDVQLKVKVSGGKITKVDAVQLPGNDPRSVQINSFAGPQLQQSALSHADGTVDAVSGATFTSNGYAAALQSVLDQAGVAATSSSANGTA